MPKETKNPRYHDLQDEWLKLRHQSVDEGVMAELDAFVVKLSKDRFLILASADEFFEVSLAAARANPESVRAKLLGFHVHYMGTGYLHPNLHLPSDETEQTLASVVGDALNEINAAEDTRAFAQVAQSRGAEIMTFGSVDVVLAELLARIKELEKQVEELEKSV